MTTHVNKLTAEQRKAWNDYYHKYNLDDYGYSTKIMAFWDFIEESNININILWRTINTLTCYTKNG